MQSGLPSIRRQLVWGALLAVLLMAAASRASAQVTETPEPFDSTGQVRSITPSLASRLQLTPPVWPVQGEYIEARLYAVSSGGFVIVAERRGGVRDRYAIGDAEREALRSAVTTAMIAGRVVGEESPATSSEPARGPFIRNQMILSAVVYGPAAGALTNSASAGTATYLLMTGASFFYLANLSKRVVVTRAQNHLATDFALRGPLATFGTFHAFGVEPNTDLAAGSTLAGGIGGSILGYQLAKRLTDSEAHSMTVGSTLLAAVGTGTLGSVGLFENVEDDDGRRVAASLVAFGLAGLPLGLQYPRRARYTVTAGDVDLLPLGAILGGAVAAIPFVESDVDDRAIAGAVTAGGVLGIYAADRLLVRRADHTESESALVWLGGVAGALMGAAIPVLTESDNGTFIAGATTLGALLGTIGAEALVEPRLAGRVRTGSGPGNGLGARLRLAPLNLGLAAFGVPGRFSLVDVRF